MTKKEPDVTQAQGSPSDENEFPSRARIRVREVAAWLVLIAATLFGGAFVLGGSFSMLNSPMLGQLALEHFPATVGLPSAALAALCLVVFFERTSGPVEFQVLGVKFKGASGPAVLWVFTFLAITAAIRLVWNLK